MKLALNWKFVLFILAVYVALFVAVLGVEQFLSYKAILPRVLDHDASIAVLPFFIFIFFSFSFVLYLLDSLAATNWIKPDVAELALYLGWSAAIGPLSEIAFNTLSRFFFETPIWTYHFLPIYGGDTSLIGIVIWPLYGFHIYCLSHIFKKAKIEHPYMFLAILIAIDAIVVEVVLNTLSLTFFHTYIFYYLAGDLGHFSTALIFIPYVISGIIGLRLIRYIESFKMPVIFGSIGFIVGLLVVFS